MTESDTTWSAAWLTGSTVNDQQDYPGWGVEQRSTPYRVACAAAGTADIPGPATGYIRLFDFIAVCPTTNGQSVTNITATLVVTNKVVFTNTNVGTGASVQTGGHFLEAGETLRFANGGANEASISTSYIDVPDTNLVVVRLVATAAFQSLVPAPANTSVRHRILEHTYYASNITKNVKPCLVGYNTDAVAHLMEWGLNSAVIGRSSSAAAAGAISPGFTPITFDITSDTGAFQVRTGEAVNTTGPLISVIYAKIPR